MKRQQYNECAEVKLTSELGDGSSTGEVRVSATFAVRQSGWYTVQIPVGGRHSMRSAAAWPTLAQAACKVQKQYADM